MKCCMKSVSDNHPRRLLCKYLQRFRQDCGDLSSSHSELQPLEVSSADAWQELES